MTNVAEAMGLLAGYARELDELSKQLTQVARHLEPVQRDYDDFIDSYELALYSRSTEEDGYKLPSEALRLKLARRAMPPELYGKQLALVSSQERLRRRIGELKTLIDAQRSILSAEKLSSEASGLHQPAWSGRAA